MTFSHFGNKFTGESGIVGLMEDLGQALNVNPDYLFLGGGNPARIDAFQQEVGEALGRIAANADSLHRLIGVYQSPQGSESFIAAFVAYVNEQLGWRIGAENVAVTQGSQSAFFMLLNLFTGAASGGDRQVVFPMLPEYLGYADQMLGEDAMRAIPASVAFTGNKRFRYHIDFEALQLGDRDALVCVSCPSNPTGKVLQAEELQQLSALTRARGIPLLIDCAYGLPFPGIIYEDVVLPYAAHHIYVLSLSKLGLPGARTGIVVAEPALIQRLVRMNTIFSLANGNFGPVIAETLITQGKLRPLCRDVLLPWYRQRRDFLVAQLTGALGELPYFLHEPEGAFFLWLWFPQLPISSAELYARLKAKNVLIMDGEHFFFAVPEPRDAHTRQCIRLTYCQSFEVMEKAVVIIAEELRALHAV